MGREVIAYQVEPRRGLQVVFAASPLSAEFFGAAWNKYYHAKKLGPVERAPAYDDEAGEHPEGELITVLGDMKF
jgi:hypothetical protein